MQPNDFAYSYSTFDRSAERKQSDRNPNIEFNGTNKPSVYGQEHRLQSGHGSESEGQPHRSRESSSHIYRGSERNYGGRYGMELQPDLLMKPNRRRYRRHGRRHSHRSKHEHWKHRHHQSKINYDKRICDKFWKSLWGFFKTKEKHHRKHRRHRKHGKHRHRVWKQALTGEGYPSVQSSILANSPLEAKILQTEAPPQPTIPGNSIWLGTVDPKKKGNEEKIEEKEKSSEKVTKSTSVEQMQQKTQETISRTKTSEESSPVKRELIDDDDQQMRQKRKIIQFIEEIAKVGMEKMKDEFVHCRTFIPNAVTRIAHDQNLKRCRFPDVICIDQTRVVLKSSDEGSDFIHASRVPLGDNPNEIIITQLPLSNTVKHFWEMVWQENVRTILLFLTLNEWKQHGENIQLIPGKGKCLHIEGFAVLTHKNEVNITPDWLVREYCLSKNNEIRRILWYHYSAWEPNRSPKDCEHLWPLHSSLRKMGRPYVCMSLAGAGRAGCYAALEWAHLMLHDKRASAINIVECVRKVRTYRMHAIQTIAQFQFLYMGIQRHIFLVEKFRKEILSEQSIFEATKKCSSIEYNYYRSGGYPTDDDFDL
uniref:Tyrosine-protein phosphatase domain-containing protein n=1 Tax=Wuchereria bancrofti TaxID=6293 RepID=A0AAF5PU10_WUCBA